MRLLVILIACQCSPPTSESRESEPRESEARERERFVDISIGDTFACGVRVDGTLRCWGASEAAPGGENWARVEQLDDYTCALDTNGQVCCWGVAGLAGDCSDRGVAYPAESFVDLTTGVDIACGLTSEGQVLCWGADAHGGTLLTDAEDVPVVVDITAMGGMLVALHADGAYSSWFVNSSHHEVVRSERRVSFGFTAQEVLLIDHDNVQLIVASGRTVPYEPFHVIPPGAAHAIADENALCALYEGGSIVCEPELNDTGHFAEQFSGDPDPEDRFTDFALWHNIDYGATGCGLLEGSGQVKCWSYLLPADPMFRQPP